MNTAYPDKDALDAGVVALARDIAANQPATLRAYKTLHAIAAIHDLPSAIAAE